MLSIRSADTWRVRSPLKYSEKFDLWNELMAKRKLSGFFIREKKLSMRKKQVRNKM